LILGNNSRGEPADSLPCHAVPLCETLEVACSPFTVLLLLHSRLAQPCIRLGLGMFCLPISKVSARVVPLSCCSLNTFLPWLRNSRTIVFAAWNQTAKTIPLLSCSVNMFSSRFQLSSLCQMIKAERIRALSRRKNVLFWYARTPKSPPLNPLFLALPRSKINTAFR
jgi:hypothetical protein